MWQKLSPLVLLLGLSSPVVSQVKGTPAERYVELVRSDIQGRCDQGLFSQTYLVGYLSAADNRGKDKALVTLKLNEEGTFHLSFKTSRRTLEKGGRWKFLGLNQVSLSGVGIIATVPGLDSTLAILQLFKNPNLFLPNHFHGRIQPIKRDLDQVTKKLICS